MIKIKKIQDYEISEDDYVSECLFALKDLPPAKYEYGDLVTYGKNTPAVVVGAFPNSEYRSWRWKYYIRYISNLSETVQQLCVIEEEIEPYKKEK